MMLIEFLLFAGVDLLIVYWLSRADRRMGFFVSMETGYLGALTKRL